MNIDSMLKSHSRAWMSCRKRWHASERSPLRPCLPRWQPWTSSLRFVHWLDPTVHACLF